MHMSKNVKTRKYGLVARYSVRNENNNLEDAWTPEQNLQK
jgi:hypothetical protein